jgi:predicted alpha/beta hydrolase
MNQPTEPPPAQHLELRATDGYRLAATHFPAATLAGAEDAADWLLVGSATAVPRGFYRRFAQAAQARGLHVLTLDYRGIGGSAPPSLRGFMPDYADWGRQDLAAGLAHASARGRTWLVGHSYGGHAIGMLPRPEQLQGAYVYAGGAGWHGYMPKSEQRKVWLLWNLLGPVATTVLGYQPLKALGIGEDIPVSVYRQWKRWCSFPRYFFDDPQAEALTRGFARITLPIVAANALDDWWALPASRDAFFAGYVNAPVERVDLDPQGLGLASTAGGIGHMGYFRPAVGAVLWPKLFASLQRQGLRAWPEAAEMAEVAEVAS